MEPDALCTCPCCGYQTLTSEYDICDICWWQHDLAQEIDPDSGIGANHVSLRQAQSNFRRFGASHEDHASSARRPTNEDVRNPSWKPLDG